MRKIAEVDSGERCLQGGGSDWEWGRRGEAAVEIADTVAGCVAAVVRRRYVKGNVGVEETATVGWEAVTGGEIEEG